MKLRKHDVTLTGSRITPRPLTEGDWDILLAWNSGPEILHDAEGDDVRGYDLAQAGTSSGARAVATQAYCFGRPRRRGACRNALDRHDLSASRRVCYNSRRAAGPAKAGNSRGRSMGDLRRRALSTWLALLAAAGPLAIGVLPAFGQRHQA